MQRPGGSLLWRPLSEDRVGSTSLCPGLLQGPWEPAGWGLGSAHREELGALS